MKYLHEDMDIRSFFGVSTSSSVASSNTYTEKGSNCSDSSSDIAEPPSKKACRELIQPSTMKRKNTGKTSSAGRVCKQNTAESATGGVWLTKPFQNWKKAILGMFLFL